MTEADESVRTAKLIQQEVQQSWHHHSQILTHFAPERDHSILHAMRRNRLFRESRTATRLITKLPGVGTTTTRCLDAVAQPCTETTLDIVHRKG